MIQLDAAGDGELSTDRRAGLPKARLSTRSWADVAVGASHPALFSTRQAHDCGVTEVDLRDALARQAIVRLKRGWYTAQRLEWPDDRHRLLVQIETSERDDVVPSHYSAAVALALPVHRPDWRTVHVMRTTPGSGQHRSGLSIHKQVGEHSTLGAALAIAQTGLLSVESGLMAYDSALRTGAVSADELAVVADELRGRVGYRRLPVMLRLGDGRRESPLESKGRRSPSTGGDTG